MRSVGVALLSALTLAGCQPNRSARQDAAPSVPEAPGPASATDFPDCGGSLKPGAARAFFQRLEQALDSGEPVPMRFYDEAVGIRSGGRYLTFHRDDFRPGAHALLSNAEWREIADRGFGDLQDIGWRGCMLGDGKAGFQSTADGELALRSFDKDRAWSSLRP
ncbi:hypothetical protein [Brevundimonas sp. FT23042]|uniref:hypothetical protein n=1 Tax=Brevundimonas sp. FT23042 TaxID=3393749 RepID=UPI003B586B28